MRNLSSAKHMYRVTFLVPVSVVVGYDERPHEEVVKRDARALITEDNPFLKGKPLTLQSIEGADTP